VIATERERPVSAKPTTSQQDGTNDEGWFWKSRTTLRVVDLVAGARSRQNHEHFVALVIPLRSHGFGWKRTA